MLSSYFEILTLSKTTSPQKRFNYDCMTLYNQKYPDPVKYQQIFFACYSKNFI